MIKNLMTVAVLAFAVTGCGQKKESISFDEALKKDLLAFEYRMVECERGSRSTDYYTPISTKDLPTDLEFSAAEEAKVGLDRGPKGPVVRISAKRADGRDVALEAEMDESRVFTGTTLVRGRDSFVYSTSDVVRHVTPRLKEMLRRKAGE